MSKIIISLTLIFQSTDQFTNVNFKTKNDKYNKKIRGGVKFGGNGAIDNCNKNLSANIKLKILDKSKKTKS